MIIITGGLGYIGTKLVDELCSSYNILIIDKMMYDVDERFFEVIKNTKILPTDLNDALECINDMSDDIDVIINLAAIVGEDACNKDMTTAWNINYCIASKLSDISYKHGIPLIQMSTCSNYGLKDEEVDENSELNPTNFYAKTKVYAEQYMFKNPNAIILRSATAYGLSYRMRFDLLLNEWVKDAYLYKKINVYSPNAYRPLIHVKDIARAIRLIIKKINDGEMLENVYNLGSNEQNYTKEEIALAISEILNTKIEYIAGKENRSYKVKFDKIKELGFEPKYTIYDGIKEITKALNNGMFNHNDIEARKYANA